MPTYSKAGYTHMDALGWSLRSTQPHEKTACPQVLVSKHLHKQGDITDPLYLDFISSIQFRVAGDEMAKGAQVFKVRAYMITMPSWVLHGR